MSTVVDRPGCCIRDMQAFKISPLQITSLSTG